MHSCERIVSSISQDPVIDDAVKSLRDLARSAKERAKFIERQMRQLKNNLKEESEPVWNSIMSQLKAKGALPKSWEHSNNDFLKYEEEDDAIYAIHVCECKACQLKKMIDSALDS